MTAAAALLAAVALSACGGSDGERLTVSAAASLTDAFEDYGEMLPVDPAFSFGGSDELAAQIRQGAEPDLYASADASLAESLAEEGLVGEPIVFARNRLVVAVPAGSEVDALGDLAAPGLDLVLGAAGVPVGDYAREVLRRLPAAERRAMLTNVRSEEPDTKSVVAKLTQGAADAGFVYASDVEAAAGTLRAVELPAGLRPEVRLAIAVVAETDAPDAAGEFIDGLLDEAGAEALSDAGFLPPR